MPVPRVEDGKWSKERERTRSGRWRKKRSDADRPRKKHSGFKRALVALVAIFIVLVVVVILFFPQWLGLPHIFQF